MPRLKGEPRATLTDRQREIVALVCEGLPNKGIGRRLGIATSTVKNQMTAIMCCTGVQCRVELALWADRRWGRPDAARHSGDEPILYG